MDVAEKTRDFTYRHPWEVSRRDCLCSLVSDGGRDLVFADIGAGDLYIIEKIRQFTDLRIIAIDNAFPNYELSDKLLMLCDVEAIEKGSVDRLLLLDVLEHIENDHSFLDMLTAVLSDRGELLISVPAFQFLFSPHDEFLRHYRRYTVSGLAKLAFQHGLEPVEKFYFYTGPLIVRFLEVVLHRLGLKREFTRVVSEWRHRETSLISRAYTGMLNLDFRINRFLGKLGILLPGLSVCLLCRKKSA
jgi:hypothetical protein